MEFIQYKTYVKQTFNITDDKWTFTKDFTPKSRIVFNRKHQDSKEDMKRAVFELYCKYIAKDCEYPINISWQTRKELNMVSNHNNWSQINISEKELYTVFDNCIKEMSRLLSYALTRALKRESILHSIQDALTGHI